MPSQTPAAPGDSDPTVRRLTGSQRWLAVALFVLVVASQILMLRSYRATDDTAAALQLSQDVTSVLADAQRDVAQVRLGLTTLQPGDDVGSVQDQLGFLGRQLSVAEASGGRDWIDALPRARTAYDELSDQLQTLATSADPMLLEAARQTASQLERAVHEAFTAAEVSSYRDRLGLLEATRRSNRFMLVSAALAAVIAVVLGRSLRRGVRRDLARAYGQLRRHAGQLQVANAQLEHANQVKDEFVSIVSHELRTPLTAIHGFTETLLRRWDDIPEADRRRYLAAIERQTVRQQRLVNDLLTRSRILTGPVMVLPEVVDVAETARNAAEAARVPVDVSTTEHIQVDPDHLDQILINLFGNAGKYGKPPVRLTTERRDGRVVIHVSDRGSGVADDRVEQLFEPFTQGDRGDRRTSTGLGLGLAIVRDLVTANGGTVAYAHTEEFGSRFSVTLPAAPTTPVTMLRTVDEGSVVATGGEEPIDGRPVGVERRT